MLLRVATTDDAEAIAPIYAPIVRDTIISFEVDPPTVDQMAERIGKTLKTHPWLVAEDGGDVLGYAYASEHRSRAAYRWACDVSVYMHESARRRGVGRRLYTRLFEILTTLGLHQAYAGITLPNAASVGLHESVGFEPIGVYSDVGYKNGAWQDVGWWGRRIQRLSTTPSEPVPFAALR
jgi:L-amino acid N-acyltransferase YncA